MKQNNLSQLVREYVEQKPFLQEALRQGIINYAALAEQIKEGFDKKFETSVKQISVIMALRRYQDNISTTAFKQVKYGQEAEVSLKTNLHMITLEKSATLLPKIAKLMTQIDSKSGGVLHFVQGNYQAAIITK